MQRRTPGIILCVFLLLAALHAGCAQSPPPPVLAPWPEQYASAKGLVRDLGSEFVLDQAVARPIRRESGAPDQPIE